MLRTVGAAAAAQMGPQVPLRTRLGPKDMYLYAGLPCVRVFKVPLSYRYMSRIMSKIYVVRYLVDTA